MRSLDGVLSRTLFHKPSKYSPSGEMFLIGKLANGTLVKGTMAKPREGESYRFWGDYQEQKPPYAGQAFVFDAFEPIIERSEAGVASYLSAYVDGLGKAKSAAIVAAFGVDTLDVLRTTPERAAEVPGISAALVESIRNHFENECHIDPAAYARLSEMFAEYRIPRRVILSLLKAFRSSAPDRVRENPYLLLDLPRMGWETVDSFALAKMGYAPDGPERHGAAIVEAMTRHTLDGHTYAERPELIVLAYPLLGMKPVDEGWRIAHQTGELVEDHTADGRTVHAPSKLWAAEQRIAERLRDLMATSRPLGFDLATDHLQGEQITAVRIIQESGVAILAGAPGTGKSYTTAVVIKSLLDNGLTSVRVGCPTGKAAKRAAELLAQHGIDRDKVPSTTIHKMLVPGPSAAPPGMPTEDSKINRGREEFGFGRNASHPLDVDYLIIDECSMCDVSLMAATLEATPNGARVLFVGDPNQLPSVGPGSVLRDMMEVIPTVFLTEIRRSQPGRIIQACHSIIKGKAPESAVRVDIENGENWVHVEIDDAHEIAAQIVEMHAPSKRFPDPIWDMQVVTPQKTRLPIACDNLNKLLSAKLNLATTNGAFGEIPSEDAERTPPFRVGDKVVRTKNGLCDLLVAPPRPPTCDAGGFDWEAGRHYTEAPDWRADWTWDGKPWHIKEDAIVNGDMGQVLDIVQDTGKRDTYVVVRFRDPDRLCRLPYGKCELIQAYALTCHKFQGSGAPYIIVPVHSSFYWDSKTESGIFSREWIYTAMSRAERLLVTVGQRATLEAAVRGRKTIHKRRTRLAELLKGSMESSS